LGLIIAIICIAVIVIFAVFAVRAAGTARSSFYVIAAGAAVTMFLTQVILNVFGPLDVIPFTGMTFPFVSRGGSSMIASWGLLAFIKAADTRQNASLAIKLNRRDMRKAAYTDEDAVHDPVFDSDDTYDEYDIEYEEDFDTAYEDDYLYEAERGEPLEGGVDPDLFDDGTWYYDE